MTNTVTLVLGAGASYSMGFPLGLHLANQIQNLHRTSHSKVLGSLGFAQKDIERFAETFLASQITSIDAFLAKRDDFVIIGKLAIASILIGLEEAEALRIPALSGERDSWMRYFFNTVTAKHPWEDLNLSQFSIVSFNYDRSFEHYFMHALASTYKRSLHDAYMKMNEMKIFHVYGALGTSNPLDVGYRRYGEPVSPKELLAASEAIKVIPEGRDDDFVLGQVRDCLISSRRIAFLGFGFDELNLARLDSQKTCAMKLIIKRERDEEHVFRVVVGTCKGMTEKEIEWANSMTAQGSDAPASQYFMDCNCEALLRRTLILR